LQARGAQRTQLTARCRRSGCRQQAEAATPPAPPPGTPHHATALKPLLPRSKPQPSPAPQGPNAATHRLPRVVAAPLLQETVHKTADLWLELMLPSMEVWSGGVE